MQLQGFLIKSASPGLALSHKQQLTVAMAATESGSESVEVLSDVDPDCCRHCYQKFGDNDKENGELNM